MRPSLMAQAPREATVTDYDLEHAALYIRILDAEESGADWREAAKVLLGADLPREAEQARRAYETHLARARWMSEGGYLQLAVR